MKIINSQKNVINVWRWLLVFFIALCFLPAFIDMDMMNGGYALIVISGFCAITSIIVIIIYRKRAQQLDELIDGKNVLAHWTYTTEEWSRYVEYDYQENKTAKLALFYLITTISLVIGIALSIISQDIVFFYIILGIIAVIAMTASLAIHLGRKQSKQSYVVISTESVLINDEFHNWTFLGARLESLTYIDDLSPTIIELVYSYPDRTGRSETAVRIPVPDKEKRHVKQILDAIIAKQ